MPILIKVTASVSFSVGKQTKMHSIFSVFAQRFKCCPTDVILTVKNQHGRPSVFTTEDNDTTVEAAGITSDSHVELLQRKDLVNRRVRKHFPGHGSFDGVVIKVNGPYMLIEYSDGDREDMYATEIFKYMRR